MYIVIDILIIVFIFLMIIYLTFDRSRFRIDQQFRYLQPEIREAAVWTEIALELHRCKKVRSKIELLSQVCKDPVFTVFHPYFDVHNELAFSYNEKLQKNIFRGIARLMGFREYVLFRYSDDIVLTSRQGNRTIRL